MMVAMSEVMAIAALLVSYGLGTLCIILCFQKALRHKDQIVTGFIDGIPVSPKHRWRTLFFDFMAYANTCMLLSAVFAFAYFRAASILGDSVVGDVALLMGVAATFAAVGILLTVVALVVYLVSTLREAEGD
jgi:hypothetical protein